MDYNPDLTRSGTTLKNFKVLTVFKSEQSELSAAGLAPAAEGGVSASFLNIDLESRRLKILEVRRLIKKHKVG